MFFPGLGGTSRSHGTSSLVSLALGGMWLIQSSLGGDLVPHVHGVQSLDKEQGGGWMRNID